MCHKVDHLGVEDMTARRATAIIEVFTVSRAQILVMESRVGFSGTVAWKDDFLPRLKRVRYAMKTIAL